MYYLFSPLMEDGKQVVRHPKEGEYFTVNGKGVPVESVIDFKTSMFPIFNLYKFDEDPLKEIRKVYEAMRWPNIPDETVREKVMWQAIVKTMEILNGTTKSNT